MKNEIVKHVEAELMDGTTFQEDIAIIRDKMSSTFVEVGTVLKSIQEDEKYKTAGYATFKEAMKQELGLEESRAYQYIRAVQSYSLLYHGTVNHATTERQLRPIVKLLPDVQKEIWQEVAKDKVPTAKEVQAAVDRRFPKSNKTKKVTMLLNKSEEKTLVPPEPTPQQKLGPLMEYALRIKELEVMVATITEAAMKDYNDLMEENIMLKTLLQANNILIPAAKKINSAEEARLDNERIVQDKREREAAVLEKIKENATPMQI